MTDTTKTWTLVAAWLFAAFLLLYLLNWGG